MNILYYDYHHHHHQSMFAQHMQNTMPACVPTHGESSAVVVSAAAVVVSSSLACRQMVLAIWRTPWHREHSLTRALIGFVNLGDIVVSNETSPTAHHPNCIGAQQNVALSLDQDVAIRDSDNLDLYFMSPEAYRAAEAIEFIAEHLRNEDQYIQVSESRRRPSTTNKWNTFFVVVD